MGVTTTKTNKPLNPRGNDQSPLAYNRAKLYSGKALDFDGVNDNLTATGSNTLSFSKITMSAYFKFDNLGATQVIFAKRKNVAGYWSAAFVMSSSGELDFRTTTGTTEQKAVYSDFVTGEYYHAVGVKDDSNNYLYINGQLVDTTASGAIDNTTTYDFVLGNNATGLYYYNGQIANAKVFDVALTAAQVADLYNNPEKVVPNGVDNTALKLWLPMMEGAGTKCLDGASLHTATERVENGDFSDGTTGWVGNPQTTLSVTNGQLDIQSAGTGYGAAFTEVNFVSGKYYLIQLDVVSCDVPTQIRIGSKNDPTLYATNIWSSGEIGIGSHSTIWYATTNDTYLAIGGRDDVDTLVIDNVSVKEVSVGNISGATWTHGVGSPVAQTSVIDWNKRILDKTNEFLIPQGLTAGRDLLGNLFENVRKQGALNLDGNSWAEVHDNASLDITSAITLEAWVYWDGTQANKGLLGRWGGVANNYLIYISTNGILQFYISTTAASNIDTSTLTAGNWYHIVGTYDGSDMRIYLNGSEEANASKTGSISTSSDAIKIGRFDQQPTYSDAIAQPRIYNRALTAEEVQRNYNAGKNTYTN